MEQVQQTIALLTETFNTRMVEFQNRLQSNTATSTSSDIAAQFSEFRLFIISALENLQCQTSLLTKQVDKIEMRSRKKMLLLHGVPETKGENVVNMVSKTLSEHLNLSEITVHSISRCHRLGKPKTDKPRAIIVKFNDLTLRNRIWFTKTNLKNTGITLSEFLTKERHETFQAARQKFGIKQCWTRDGDIIISMPNGSRQRISNMNEFKALSLSGDRSTIPSSSSKPAGVNQADIKGISTRQKRNIKK